LAALQFDAVYDAVWGTTVQKGDLTRLDIWAQTFDLVSKHPLFGTGPAGYAAYFMSLYRNTGFSLSTHNNYLDVIAQTGVVGSVVFVWLMVTLVVVGWVARARWQTGFLGGYAQGAFGGLIGLLVAMSQGDWFIPFVYNQTIAGFRYTVHSWIFLGFLASLALEPAVRHVLRSAGPQTDQPSQSSNRQAPRVARASH
jgi:O-antigen ligase